MAKKLYVGNLAYTVREDELQELFGQAGKVESVKIINDTMTGRSKGFAFVEMMEEDEAQKAKEMFNGYTFKERKLVVDDARPQRERGDRDFGGGRRGGKDRGYSRY
ncbi:MAG: RNA-binding protein [Candidatus Aminicenantes bacterium]|nr:RNA-binding protein [Candidatus Aminicenantes bacterium]MDH5715054.1 RNA-binding protein [Candidatus Aminicenantes bacterium]